MTVFGSKVLKAYVILVWSGAVPRWGGGGGGGGHGGIPPSPPPPIFFFWLVFFIFFFLSPVMYIDDENIPNLLW